MKLPAAILLPISALATLGCVSADARQPAPSPPAQERMVPQAALDAYIDLRQARRAELWRAFPGEQDAIVFAGSSIVEEGPFEAMFPGYTVVNRGIGADTTIGLLRRLDEIIALRPSKLFLYIGGNDRSRLDDTPEAAFARLEEIVQGVREASPATQLYLHTLFPREAEHAAWITAFNARVRELGVRSGVDVVDVYTLALGEGGAIDPALTNDGIHLLPEGYRRWQKVLQSGPLPPKTEPRPSVDAEIKQ